MTTASPTLPEGTKSRQEIIAEDPNAKGWVPSGNEFWVLDILEDGDWMKTWDIWNLLSTTESLTRKALHNLHSKGMIERKKDGSSYHWRAAIRQLNQTQETEI